MSKYPATIRVLNHARHRHRNGICGAPFTVALIDDGESKKVAILFDAPDHCAVLDIGKLAQGDIAFGSNSYRGDCYEPDLRRALARLTPES